MDDAIFGGMCEVIHQGKRKYCVVIRRLSLTAGERERERERERL